MRTIVDMDLQWRVAWKRQWIEQGRREGLTYREVARRAGVCERTVRRWNATFLEEERSRQLAVSSTPAVEASPLLGVTPPQVPDPSEATEPFAEVVDSSGAPEGQIQIELEGGARVVIAGPLDVTTLSRVIAAVKQC